MALLFEAWQADGKGQALHSCMRSDSKGYSHEGRNLKIQEWKANPQIVLITKNRTDGQSNIEHVLYTKPGYIDPCL